MKKSTILNPVKATFFGVSLALLASTLPVAAQTTTAPDGTGTTTTTTDTTYNRDNGFDWGWLGLTGLLGLLGLSGKRNEPKRYNDPNVTASSRTDY